MDKEYILDMSANELRQFLMESTSYFNVMLPTYFDFHPVLIRAQKLLNKHKCLSNLAKLVKVPKKNKNGYKIKPEMPSNIDNLNYTLFLNKNGKYDWRPLTLIHPLLYVDFVNYITKPVVWRKIRSRFKLFESDSHFECYSIPFEDHDNRNTYVKTSILNWWRGIEQESIKCSSKYNYCVKTDIANCYGSIYTHTISWAIEGKSKAKKEKYKNTLIGNVIDKKNRTYAIWTNKWNTTR